jgi:hypothetical protein
VFGVTNVIRKHTMKRSCNVANFLYETKELTNVIREHTIRRSCNVANFLYETKERILMQFAVLSAVLERLICYINGLA